MHVDHQQDRKSRLPEVEQRQVEPVHARLCRQTLWIGRLAMIVAAVYARKSTDDSNRNEEARSIPRQIAHATEYAKRRGWVVDPRFVFSDHDVSGAEWKHRPGWNALIAALEPRPPFGVLIVSELSRIGRDTVRTPAAILQLEEAGVEIRSYMSDTPI